MANLQTDDFTLTVGVGYNNMKTLIDAASASLTVPSYKWAALTITNTGAAACTIRRTPKNETTASTTNGKNLAAAATATFTARESSYIDGTGIWIYSAAGTTIDVSIVRAGN